MLFHNLRFVNNVHNLLHPFRVFSASEGLFEVFADKVVGYGNVVRGITWAIIEDILIEEAE